MKPRYAIALPVVLLASACQQEPASEPEDDFGTAEMTQVVVTECYNSGGDLSVEINGSPLLLTPVGQRDDTTGMCFWDGIVLPSSVSITFSGPSQGNVSLRNETGKTLRIPATDPGSARFVDAAEMKLD